VDWLAQKTGKSYRLLSEAEWEYAARGQTSPGAYPRYWFGNDERELCRYGNGFDQTARDGLSRGRQLPGFLPCNDGYLHTSPAGHYAPNFFGLYDMFGNANQWTADCWHPSYSGAPTDGTPWTSPGACTHVIRGGAWGGGAGGVLRAASRRPGDNLNYTYGFRVARTLAAEATPLATEEKSRFRR
jgi:formylglycine-generating enzyme required for sulfatase activity